MRWPIFLTTMVLQCCTYWIKVFHQARLLHRPRRLRMPHASHVLYTDATHGSTAVFAPAPPPVGTSQHYTDHRPISPLWKWRPPSKGSFGLPNLPSTPNHDCFMHRLSFCLLHTSERDQINPSIIFPLTAFVCSHVSED
jgi:hypothetical protein